MTRKKPWSCPTASPYCARANWSRSRLQRKFTATPPLPTPPSSSAILTCFEPMSAAELPSPALCPGHCKHRTEADSFRCARSAFVWHATVRMVSGSTRACSITRSTAPANWCALKLQTHRSLPFALLNVGASEDKSNWNSRRMTLFPSASQESEHVLPRIQGGHHPAATLVGNSVLAAAVRADVRLQLLVRFSVAGHCSFVEFCQLCPVVLPRCVRANL